MLCMGDDKRMMTMMISHGRRKEEIGKRRLDDKLAVDLLELFEEPLLL